VGRRIELESGVACDLTVLDPNQRERHEDLLQGLFGGVRVTREIIDGFSFEFSDSPGLLVRIAEWMTLERLCCPFLRFRLEVIPPLGEMRLSIAGPSGTKELMAGYTKQE